MAHEFYVAWQLRMTVAELRDRMDNREFLWWTRFFAVKAQTEDLQAKAAAAKFGG